METITRTTDFWDVPLAELLRQLDATPQGLTSEEARYRLREYGPNSLVKQQRFQALFDFLRLFANPLIIILLIASSVSFVLKQHVDAVIIILMVFLGVLLNFYQEYQARHSVEALRQQVASTALVVRDGKEQELPVTDLVPGDIIILNAGSLVPADCRLIEEKDLYVRESALTGESMPVEKEAKDLRGGTHGVTDAENSVFLGTAVQSGIARAVVVRTGAKTAFGAIAQRLSERPPETEFDRGIRQFALMITRVILFLVTFAFLTNIGFKRPLLESFLFSVALAVGLTPELLPMIISVTLAQGAKRMAKKKVIVKQLASIENFGSMEILCSDKTGTLTIGEVVLERHVDLRGNEDQRVLQMIYLNSYFEAGVRSPLDDAVLKHERPDIHEYSKVEEIPFDFERRRLSVVVKKGDERFLVTKGAVENVFDVCSQVEFDQKTRPFDKECQQIAARTYETLSSDGYRVLGVAVKQAPDQPSYGKGDEKEMALVGFAAFLDPPKEGVGETIKALKRDGIDVVIMTGDNEFVTRKVAHDVGIPADHIIVGSQMDTIDDAALAYQAEHGAIFAKVSPEQKNRVITALHARGKVVGFLGDGINDAPSMHTADIGISVVNAVDVAKDAANIILMERSLSVLHDGVIEGRRSFANIMKYITMGTSSNFGNMFSMAAASLFMPFLPMLPIQILVNNFLYDLSQVSIPTDNVDDSMLRQPKRWHINFIRQFMVIIGPISSIYDFATFAILLFAFNASETLFHSGWFVESLATQTLVIFVIRTAGNPMKSRPSPQVAATVLAIVAVAVGLTYTDVGRIIGFEPLPPLLLVAITLLTVTYLALVQIVKTWFYRKHALM